MSEVIEAESEKTVEAAPEAEAVSSPATPSPAHTFKTQTDAVRFLTSQGFKISKATFNEHLHRGSVCTNEDGFFHKSTLLGYAVNNLRSTVVDGDVRGREAQMTRASSDADLKQVKAERERIRLKKEQGLVMPRVEHENALAARALFFRQEIQSFIYRKADDIIELVGGNEKNHHKLVHFWEKETADWMDAWSTERDFSISDENLDDDYVSDLFDDVDEQVGE